MFSALSLSFYIHYFVYVSNNAPTYTRTQVVRLETNVQHNGTDAWGNDERGLGGGLSESGDTERKSHTVG